MAKDPQQVPSLFTQFDVSPNSSSSGTEQSAKQYDEVVGLLQDVVAGQDRQNQLLEEMISQMGAAQRRRNQELGQWKQANPDLSKQCRRAVEWLSQAQTEYLRGLTSEVNESADDLAESDFLLNEMIDRYGPRLAHLNGVLQVLSQLGINSNSDPSNTNE